jgi:hypothetical protein
MFRYLRVAVLVPPQGGGYDCGLSSPNLYTYSW